MQRTGSTHAPRSCVGNCLGPLAPARARSNDRIQVGVSTRNRHHRPAGVRDAASADRRAHESRQTAPAARFDDDQVVSAIGIINDPALPITRMRPGALTVATSSRSPLQECRIDWTPSARLPATPAPRLSQHIHARGWRGQVRSLQTGEFSTWSQHPRSGLAAGVSTNHNARGRVMDEHEQQAERRCLRDHVGPRVDHVDAPRNAGVRVRRVTPPRLTFEPMRFTLRTRSELAAMMTAGPTGRELERRDLPPPSCRAHRWPTGEQPGGIGKPPTGRRFRRGWCSGRT